MHKAALLAILSAATLFGQAARFDGKQLLLPEDYREWPLVGASLGLSYNEPGATPREPQFHNVYLDPGSYKQFRETGTFPDGAVLMMEVYSAAGKESINRQGSFADRFLRVEAAVKAPSRFEEGWAYFDFAGPEPKPRADAFAKDRCWSCHNEHGATDNVFTQFYGPLRAARR